MTGATLSLIVTNARIRTADPARPWATALGVRDGKLAVVGSAAEILKMADAHTRVIDHGGRILAIPAGTSVGSDVVVSTSDNGVTLLSKVVPPSHL